MKALWPLVGCLLYLAASPATSSTNQCVWQDLTEKKLYGGAIQIKTKDQEEGELSVTIDQKLLETKKLEPSRLYTLNITCIKLNCSYLLLNDDGDNISNYEGLYKPESSKLIVTGQNLEWSPVCQREYTETNTTMTTTPTTITNTTTTPETTTTALKITTTTPETTTTTPETTTTTLKTTTTTPETTTTTLKTTTTTPETTTTTPETTTTTPKTTTTSSTTRRTTTTPAPTTVRKKTPRSTSSQRSTNEDTETTTTNTTTTTTASSSGKSTNVFNNYVIIVLVLFPLLAFGLGLCFIYRHRITGALDLHSQACTDMEGAQDQAGAKQEPPVSEKNETLV